MIDGLSLLQVLATQCKKIHALHLRLSHEGLPNSLIQALSRLHPLSTAADLFCLHPMPTVSGQAPPSVETGLMSSIEAGQMSSIETAQMSDVETGQMSAAATGQMSAVETRQMLKSQIAGFPPKKTQFLRKTAPGGRPAAPSDPAS